MKRSCLSVCVLLFSCQSPRYVAAPSLPADASIPEPTLVTETPKDAAPPIPLAPHVNLLKCGCALCEPVFSSDPCTSDSDCGPSAPCHAPACVAKAKAHPAKPGTLCTQDMRCDTLDANRCGCLNGRCALYANK